MRLLTTVLFLLLATPVLANDLYIPVSSYTVTTDITTDNSSGTVGDHIAAVRFVCTVDCFVGSATATDADAIATTQPVFLPADVPIIMRVDPSHFILVNSDSTGTLHVTEMSK